MIEECLYGSIKNKEGKHVYHINFFLKQSFNSKNFVDLIAEI